MNRYGIVLIKRQRKTLAVTVLIESVNQYPYNWSAWLDLGPCLPSLAAVSSQCSWSYLLELTVKWL